MTRTPSGRRLGRRLPTPDPRDLHFVGQSLGWFQAAPPPQVDLEPRLPPVLDQGDEGSCGACAGSALLCLLYPDQLKAGFSRQQLYYSTRLLEDSTGDDGGVETRNLLRTMTKVGAAPEPLWPYTPENLYRAPSAAVLTAASRYRLSSYSRLTSQDDITACLAQGFPFIIGFSAYESFDGPALGKSGVMTTPDPKREKLIGGHNALVVGYDLQFRESAVLRRSGVDPALVAPVALKVRNSWGPDWGLRGHWWMPINYALNPSTGGDNWTGRL